MGRLKKGGVLEDCVELVYLSLRLRTQGRLFRINVISAYDFYGYGKDGRRRLRLDLRCGRTCFPAIKPAFTL
jgi:hypothetical protein